MKRTIDEVTEEYLRHHPEELQAFVEEACVEFLQDKDMATFLALMTLVVRLQEEE